MSNNFIAKVSNAFDFAVTVYLIVGGFYFITYSLLRFKIIYIFLTVLIFLLSYLSRKYLLKSNKSKFSEKGIFLIAGLFLAYLIAFLDIDPEVNQFLPEKILLTSGSGFIFLIVISVFLKESREKLKLLNLIFVFVILLLLNNYQYTIELFLENNPWVSKTVIGAPLIYLFTVLAGLRGNINKKVT